MRVSNAGILGGVVVLPLLWRSVLALIVDIMLGLPLWLRNLVRHLRKRLNKSK